jgi:hypothetical protein
MNFPFDLWAILGVACDVSPGLFFVAFIDGLEVRRTVRKSTD